MSWSRGPLPAEHPHVLSVVLALAISTPGSGALTGELRYPGCEVPGDLEVCAEQDGVVTCTDELKLEDGKLTYRLEVPAGTYRIFSRTESMLPNVRAYYTSAVLCGLDVTCTDHAPIPVVVRPGELRAAVHPSDWVAPEPPKPIQLAER